MGWFLAVVGAFFSAMVVGLVVGGPLENDAAGFGAGALTLGGMLFLYYRSQQRAARQVVVVPPPPPFGAPTAHAGRFADLQRICNANALNCGATARRNAKRRKTVEVGAGVLALVSAMVASLPGGWFAAETKVVISSGSAAISGLATLFLTNLFNDKRIRDLFDASVEYQRVGNRCEEAMYKEFADDNMALQRWAELRGFVDDVNAKYAAILPGG